MNAEVHEGLGHLLDEERDAASALSRSALVTSAGNRSTPSIRPAMVRASASDSGLSVILV